MPTETGEFNKQRAPRNTVWRITKSSKTPVVAITKSTHKGEFIIQTRNVRDGQPLASVLFRIKKISDRPRKSKRMLNLRKMRRLVLNRRKSSKVRKLSLGGVLRLLRKRFKSPQQLPAYGLADGFAEKLLKRQR